MREIKFRAWDGVQFWYSDSPNADFVFGAKGCGVYVNGELQFDLTPDNTQQYTRLKDKNDKEIYEGDIVKTPSYPGEQTSNVIFKNGSFGIYLDGTKLYGSEDPQGRGWIEISQYSYDTEDDFEIIGNIYENPELIKETQ